MITFEEFENALLNGDSVHVADGRGVLFYFYACRKSDVCGLITACVETSVILDEIDCGHFKSAAVVSSMEAYLVYKKLLTLA